MDGPQMAIPPHDEEDGASLFDLWADIEDGVQDANLTPDGLPFLEVVGEGKIEIINGRRYRLRLGDGTEAWAICTSADNAGEEWTWTIPDDGSYEQSRFIATLDRLGIARADLTGNTAPTDTDSNTPTTNTPTQE